MSATAEVLADARALVAEGWCQGELEVIDPDPAVPNRYCPIGAILAAAPGDGAAEPSWPGAAARAALRDANGIEGSLAEWNDAPGRTQAQVLEAFDRAVA